MLHMNQQPRYQAIWRDLVSVYALRGNEASHYIAGMCIGTQIAAGLSEDESKRLGDLLRVARYAKR